MTQYIIEKGADVKAVNNNDPGWDGVQSSAYGNVTNICFLEHPGSGTVQFGTTRLSVLVKTNLWNMDTAVRLLLIHEYVLVLH